MNLQLDATIVDAWTEFIRLQEQGSIEDLDEKSRNIIYVVAAAEARGEKANQKCVLKALKPRSHMPILSRLNALIRQGWLSKENDPNDRRMKNLRLTAKSIAHINVLSATLRKVVKPTIAVAAGLVALLLDCDKSSTYIFATELLAI